MDGKVARRMECVRDWGHPRSMVAMPLPRCSFLGEPTSAVLAGVSGARTYVFWRRFAGKGGTGSTAVQGKGEGVRRGLDSEG